MGHQWGWTCWSIQAIRQRPYWVAGKRQCSGSQRLPLHHFWTREAGECFTAVCVSMHSGVNTVSQKAAELEKVWGKWTLWLNKTSTSACCINLFYHRYLNHGIFCSDSISRKYCNKSLTGNRQVCGLFCSCDCYEAYTFIVRRRANICLLIPFNRFSPGFSQEWLTVLPSLWFLCALGFDVVGSVFVECLHPRLRRRW